LDANLLKKGGRAAMPFSPDSLKTLGQEGPLLVEIQPREKE
jgi:hypothetical protein